MVVAITGCGGSSSASSPPTGISISLISPASALAGSADLTLTLTGSNFLGEPHNLSQAAWSANGSVTFLATTFVSSTQLTAVVPAALLSKPVTAQVLLETGDPMGDVGLSKSNSVIFMVTAPQPGQLLISSISPMSAVADSPDLTLTITGSNFDGKGVIRSRVVWTANGIMTPLGTTFVSSKQLTAVIPAALLSNPVTAQVLVQNWDQIEEDVAGATSNSVNFSVTSAATESSGFTAAGSMGAARSWHSATLLPNGIVLVVGGADHLGVLDSAELYDPTKGTFTSTGNLVAPRQGHTATLLADGRVLIAGGEDNAGPIGSAELYDPATGRFSSVGNMNNARWSHTATLLANGKVLIAGGANNFDSQDSAELFDPARGSFTAIDNMISARMHHTATPLANGKVLLVGGWSSYSPITPLASAELFDPATNMFASVGSMSIPRYLHESTLLPDGKVLILGGSEDHFSVSGVEAYDPVSEAFVGAGNLSAKRTSHTVTMLPNGKVLIVGGTYVFSGPDAPESAVLASSELYTPTSQESMFTATLQTPRVGHTATLLNDGHVLVTGGADGNGNPLASTELFQ